MLHTIFPHGKRDPDPVFQATKNSDVVWLDVPTRSRHPCGRRLSTSDTLHPYPSLYYHHYDKSAESLHRLNVVVETAEYACCIILLVEADS